MTYSKEQYDNDLKELQEKYRERLDKATTWYPEYVYSYLAVLQDRIHNFTSYGK